MESFPSFHILGSREFGGADQFYVRLVRALHAGGQTVTAINRGGSPVAEALAGDTVKQVHLPLANRWDLWSLCRIRREIRRNPPAVVQTYMGRATRLTRVPAGLGIPHVARLGGFYKVNGYYRHADAWVGNTRAICDYLIKEGLPAKRVFHIGNFVPEPLEADPQEQAALKERHQIPADAWVIFALGRLIGKKGFDALLKAVARLPREIAGRPVVLAAAGDGPIAEELKALAAEIGVADRVRWLGWLNPPDAFYAMADVFVCPSRHEPLGNVILEAWARRLPVVSTRNEGAAELIEEGADGLLCGIGDDQGMAEMITRVLEAAPAERAALGEAGHAKLHARYSQQSIIDAYFSLYRELIRGV